VRVVDTQPEAVGKEPKAAATPGPAHPLDIFLKRLEDLEGRVARELERPAQARGPLEEFVLDLGRELWMAGSGLARGLREPQNFIAARASRFAAAPTDDLGMDEHLSSALADILRPVARAWLGLDESRSARFPEHGGVLVLLNRSAWPLPVEALVLWAHMAGGRCGQRRVHALWDAGVFELPVVGDFLHRAGLVAATPENAAELLSRGAVVLGFPEGRAALAKTYQRRYRLERFDDAALIGAAIEAGASIVPGAVVGSEESYPVLGHAAGFPLTPVFPLLGIFGLLPLPLKWRLRLGATVEYVDVEEGNANVDGLSDALRVRMQALLGELLGERRSLVTG
jgi:1-acyl-sn-glycerol-3-phosphate acyltransferase